MGQAISEIVSGVVYALADQADAATDSTTSDAVAWGKIVLGALFLLLAARNWRHRPAAGAQPEVPKWMAGIDALKPGKALGLSLLAGRRQTRRTGDAVGSLVVFVIVGSLTIAAPVY